MILALSIEELNLGDRRKSKRQRCGISKHLYQALVTLSDAYFSLLFLPTFSLHKLSPVPVESARAVEVLRSKLSRLEKND